MNKKLLKECVRIAKSKLDQHPERENYPHYTFIVKNGKILGYGTNRVHEPPVHMGYHKENPKPKLHAEIDAFNRYKGYLKSDPYEMINIRLSKEGELRMAKPCSCCYSLLKSLNCKTFYYSTEEKFDKIS